MTFASNKLWNGAENTATREKPHKMTSKQNKTTSKQNNVFPVSLHWEIVCSLSIFVNWQCVVLISSSSLSRSSILAFVLELSISFLFSPLSHAWNDTVLPVGVGTVPPVAWNELFWRVMYLYRIAICTAFWLSFGNTVHTAKAIVQVINPWNQLMSIPRPSYCSQMSNVVIVAILSMFIYLFICLFLKFYVSK